MAVEGEERGLMVGGQWWAADRLEAAGATWAAWSSPPLKTWPEEEVGSIYPPSYFCPSLNNLHEINVFLSFPQISGVVDERNLKKFFAGFYLEMFGVLMQIPLITNTSTP